ncbi:MAG: hypothetical protein AB1941_07460 [Gemmatimonadota bacterium]
MLVAAARVVAVAAFVLVAGCRADRAAPDAEVAAVHDAFLDERCG